MEDFEFANQGKAAEPEANPLKFFVPGIPAPGGSKRAFYIKELKRAIVAPASKKTKPWMQAVAGCVRAEYDGEVLQGPLSVEFQFRFLRPKSHYRTGQYAGYVKNSAPLYPTGRPDRTKVMRSTEDALTGILWKDDSQIVAGDATKIYVERDPGVVITVFVNPLIHEETFNKGDF
jgi:Holliday junction resolvase RusA-like endonuclease